MDEKQLSRIALFSLIIGFIGLVLLALFQGAVLVDASLSSLPKDTTISFQAHILSLHDSSSGTVIVLQRPVNTTGFIHAEVPSALQGKDVLITGEFDGEWLSVQSISLLNASAR